jgi:hypothetical protein
MNYRFHLAAYRPVCQSNQAPEACAWPDLLTGFGPKIEEKRPDVVSSQYGGMKYSIS